MLYLRTLIATLILAATVSAQAITEPPDFSNSFPGTGPTIVGRDCVLLATGTIEPGDVDWIRITLPVAMSQTVVDLDFAEGAGTSLLSVNIEGGGSGFNTGDQNNDLDNRCGLGADSIPVGSVADTVVSVGATGRDAVIDIGITAGSDNNFNGAHGENFAYELWLHLTPVPCTSNGDCADPHDCTIDTCDTGTGVCSNEPDDSLCDDSVFCNGVEICSGDAGCEVGSPPMCDDGVECTIDRCDAVLDICVNTPDDSICDNTIFCDGVETCDTNSGCVSGPSPTCDDGVDCTVNRCDIPSDSCANDPNDAACADKSICDGDEICDPEAGCVEGAPLCGEGLCRETDGVCVDCLGDDGCDDGDLCNGSETCDASGFCQSGAAPCDPDQTCDPITGDCRDVGAPSVTLDIKPGACPNNLPRNSRGFISAAIVSVDGFDVGTVNATSVTIRRADGVGGSVSAADGPPGPGTNVSDVATPFEGDPCDCHALEGDGTADLVVRFSVQELVSALELAELPSREPIELLVSAALVDGSVIELADCIELSGNARRGNRKINTQLQSAPFAPCGAAGATAMILTLLGLVSMRLHAGRKRRGV